MDDISLQAEQTKSPSSAEEFGEEGHEVEEDNLVPIAVVKSATTTGNESDIDGDDSCAAVTGGDSRKSLCQTRRNKLVAILAGAALVLIVALTAGLVPYFNNKGKGENRSAQMIAATAATGGGEEEQEEVETYYPTFSPTTYSPTPALTLPAAGIVSNDFSLGDGANGSNDSDSGRERRLKGTNRRRR